MTRPSLSWPISILAGAGVIIVLLLIHVITTPISARPNTVDCADGNPAYPACQKDTQTSEAKTTLANSCVDGNDAYPICLTQTAQGGSQPSATTGSSGGSNNAPNNTPTFTATPTTTNTATVVTASAPAATGTPTATRTATSQSAATTAGPADTSLPTPTPLIPADAPILICVPGERVEIAGETRPSIPLIVYFDQRAVGGGTSTSTGSYLLRMQIGDEAPGLYLVEVRERGSRALIQQLGCDVPAFTPTATVSLVP